MRDPRADAIRGDETEPVIEYFARPGWYVIPIVSTEAAPRDVAVLVYPCDCRKGAKCLAHIRPAFKL